MTKAQKSADLYTTIKTANGYAVCRNDVSIKTPAGAAFSVPTLDLAEAIAAEWRAQTDKVNPSSMPLMQLAATALDILPKERATIVVRTMAYAQSELLCHRALHPAALVQRQEETWQPVLDWCALRFEALLNVGAGIAPLRQNPLTVETLSQVMAAHDNFWLTGLSHAVEVSGSLVLGLALAERHLTADEVFQAAQLDENFQIEKWGEDPAIRKRQEGIRQDLGVCEKWFGLLA